MKPGIRGEEEGDAKEKEPKKKQQDQQAQMNATNLLQYFNFAL